MLVLMGPIKRKRDTNGKEEGWVRWRRRAVNVNRTRYEKEGFKPLCDNFLRLLFNLAATRWKPAFHTCQKLLQSVLLWRNTVSWVTLRECGVGSHKRDDTWRHGNHGRRPRMWEDVSVNLFGVKWVATRGCSPTKPKSFVVGLLCDAFSFVLANVTF